jgi:cytosine permease
MHSTTPVPIEQSLPGYRITLVTIGISFTLTGLYAGAELASSLGLQRAIRAILVGSLVLGAVSIPAAIIGSRTRLSTYMIVSHVFGRKGSIAVNVLLAIVLLGWYAVTAELFGHACYITLAERFPSIAQWEYTIACSAIVTGTTVVGFRAIDRLSLMAAPLLVALTVYVGWRSLQHTSWSVMSSAVGGHMEFAEGVSAVIGAAVVGVLLMPDITRYCRSTSDSVMVCVVGNGLGNAVALTLAALPALAFHELDPMKYLGVLHLAGLGFVVLVISTWTMNAINLYSTGLVTAAALRSGLYGPLVIVCGIAGTALAVLGVADLLIKFLVLLGLIVPPVAGVYMTDYFVLGHRDYGRLDADDNDFWNINALLACLCGAAVGMTMYFRHISLTGVPTIESFLSACTFYFAAERLRVSWQHARP